MNTQADRLHARLQGRAAMMNHTRARFGWILAIVSCGVLCGLSESASASDDASMPAAECIDRPKGVQPPPKRLAPVPRPRKGKEYSKEQVRPPASTLQMNSVCPEGKVPVIKAFATVLGKGNPLLGPDPA